jgi:hypothetical protein
MNGSIFFGGRKYDPIRSNSKSITIALILQDESHGSFRLPIDEKAIVWNGSLEFDSGTAIEE